MEAARHVVQGCHRLGKPCSNLKMQKVLYFMQAEFLVAAGRPCFSGRIVAYDWGPVVPGVYMAYRAYGAADMPLPETAGCLFSGKDRELADGVIAECAGWSAAALEELTQRQPPWREAYGRGWGSVISPHSIRDFFSAD